MLAIYCVLCLLAMCCALLASIIGKTIYDKILCVNVFGTVTVAFIALFGFFTQRPEFLDIAIVYALINFIATLAVLKFFEYGNMGSESQKDPEATDGSNS